MNIKCAKFVRDVAHRNREEDREFWYFGEEINDYLTMLREQPDADHQKAAEKAQGRVASGHDFTAVDELIKRFAALAR